MNESTYEGRVAPLKSITVEWYEGFQFIQYPFTLYLWAAFHKFLEYLWEREIERTDSYGGYTKVKVRIEWENGDVLVDRVDVGSSKHDFRPQFISIGSCRFLLLRILTQTNFNLLHLNVNKILDDIMFIGGFCLV